VRAKRALRDHHIGLDLPDGADLAARLESVLEVIYLLFNEGYSAHAGESLVRHDLCGEAIRLGRLVAGSPRIQSPTAHALVALMALQAARLPARIDARGELVLLEDQDRSLWNPALLALGFAHLERSAEGSTMSPYHAQAAIAALHARAETPGATRWPEIVALYDQLAALNPSPVVRLNRAVAISRVHGAAAALAALAPLEHDPAMKDYFLLHCVKGRLLAELGEHAAAAAAYSAALARPCSDPARRFVTKALHDLS
jgi:RNA polymerase sigma-70 factor, ECF subfamily